MSNNENINPSQLLFKAILIHEFYIKYKELITPDLFPKEFKGLLKSVEHNHKKFEKDITLDELVILHQSLNPTITKSNLKFLKDSLYQLNDISSDISEDVIQSSLESCYRTKLSTELADISLQIGLENKYDNLDRAKEIINRLEQRKFIEQDGDIEFKYTSTDLDEIFELVQTQFPWKFNLPEIQKNLKGIGPGTFGVVAAIPDAGKTAFWVSLTFGPGGFLEQGAKVHVIANEEKAENIMARGICCNTGFMKDELIENTNDCRAEAREKFTKIKDNLFIIDSVDLYIEQLSKYCQKFKPDILIIDQLDKIKKKGGSSNQRTDEHLKSIYTAAREIAKRSNCAVIAISQASDKATGKLFYGFDALENSKIGKAAEADYVLTIGMESIATTNGTDSGYRMCNFPKNKLTGAKSPVAYMLNRDLSRMNP